MIYIVDTNYVLKLQMESIPGTHIRDGIYMSLWPDVKFKNLNGKDQSSVLIEDHWCLLFVTRTWLSSWTISNCPPSSWGSRRGLLQKGGCFNLIEALCLCEVPLVSSQGKCHDLDLRQIYPVLNLLQGNAGFTAWRQSEEKPAPINEYTDGTAAGKGG